MRSPTSNEAAAYDAVRLAATRAGARLFRNQTGLYRLDDGRMLRSGLCVGSSDLIGWKTEDIGGIKVARFVAVECKRGSRRATAEQQAFLEAVRNAGGIAIELRVDRDIDAALSEGGL